MRCRITSVLLDIPEVAGLYHDTERFRVIMFLPAGSRSLTCNGTDSTSGLGCKELPSAVVTKSLSLEHQVGAMPGAPKASLWAEPGLIGLLLSDGPEHAAADQRSGPPSPPARGLYRWGSHRPPLVRVRTRCLTLCP